MLNRKIIYYKLNEVSNVKSYIEKNTSEGGKSISSIIFTFNCREKSYSFTNFDLNAVKGIKDYLMGNHKNKKEVK